MPRSRDPQPDERYGHWTVIGSARSIHQPSGALKRVIPCRCDCGTEREVLCTNLRNGGKQCGPKCPAPFLHLVGERFGSYTVLAVRQSARCIVKCDCGTTRELTYENLRNGGHTQCYACAQKARGKKRRHHPTLTARSPTYLSWKSMNHRCYAPNDVAFHLYGGRGIRICDQWLAEAHGGESGGFARFVEDMGVRPDGMTLDRKDSEGNYEPGNCRWATPTEQARNRRDSQVTHCPQGHPYDEANTHIQCDGSRRCRACDRERHRKA